MYFFFFDEEGKNELKEYYIAYFDILGYKAYFEDENIDENSFLHTITECMKDIKKGIQIAENLNMNEIKIDYRVYSDNFLFYIDGEIEELKALTAFSYLLSLIQHRLLKKHSILLRGGVTKGKFYAGKEFIFGKDLIDAYKLENEEALYSRIIFNKKCFSKKTIKTLIDADYIIQDEDEYCYINFFSCLGEIEEENSLKANIVKLTNINSRYRNTTDLKKIHERERLVAKYLWLITRYNEYFESRNKKENLILYKTEINKRVLKVEVSCR